MKKMVLCGVTAGLTAAMVMLSGCGSKGQKIVPPPGSTGMLGSRGGVIPSPYRSPASLKYLNQPAPVIAEPVVEPVPTEIIQEPAGQNANPPAGNLESIMPPPSPEDNSLVIAPLQPAPVESIDEPLIKDISTDTAHIVPLDNSPSIVVPPPAVDSTSPKGIDPNRPVKDARTYKVRKGDTLTKISIRYGVTWQEMAKANNLNYKSILRVGDVLVLPENATEPAATVKTSPVTVKNTKKSASAAGSTVASVGAKPLPADGIYVVASGDSLWKIGHKYGISVSNLKKWNSLKSETLKVGQKLKLKGAEGTAETAGTAAATTKTSKTDAAPKTTTTNKDNAPKAQSSDNAGLSSDKHIVKSGDNLWTLARKYKVTRDDLIKWNNLKSTNLRIGQALIVKKGVAESSASAAPVEEAPVAPLPVTPVLEEVKPLPVTAPVTAVPVPEVSASNVVNIQNPGAPVVLDAKGSVTIPAPVKVEAPVVAVPVPEVPKFQGYVVNNDETLEAIAARNGITVEKLKELNPTLKDGDDLKPGMEIRIPTIGD